MISALSRKDDPRATALAVPAGYDAAQMVIHAAQVSLPNAFAAIFPGADTDTLRAKWRVDGCHFPASHDKRKEGPAVTFAGKTR